MLESTCQRLCKRGGAALRLARQACCGQAGHVEAAGELKVPFTTGILIGIGETRAERIDALVAIRRSARRHGHIQEVIVQNFRAKPDTSMANAEEPDARRPAVDHRDGASLSRARHEHPGAAQSVARSVSNADRRGVNDWGGISPVTPDHVNPEAPWPAIAELRARPRTRASAGERASRLPRLRARRRTWLDSRIATRVRRLSDAEGFARDDDWAPGNTSRRPAPLVLARGVDAGIARIVERATSGERLAANDIVRLFAARGADYRHVTQAADALRRAVSGDAVRYVVNRNINYTNICYFRCKLLRLLQRPHARGSARLAL